QAGAGTVGWKGNAPEVAAVDIRNAVVTRQPFVDERVVGGEQLENVVVLPHLTVEEQFGFPPERFAQTVVEPREQLGIGGVRRQIPEIQPLSEEVREQRF